MLADHAGHHLRVVIDIEGTPYYTDDLFDNLTLIGGDAIGDISFEEYLSDWEDL